MKILKSILNRIRGEQSLNKLISRGLKVGKNLTIMSGCIIDPSHCWHIEIGDNVIIAPRVHILAHDASTKLFINYTKVANVKIGNNVFIGAGSIIMPGVTIGNNVVIGAGSLVSKDVPDSSVAVGSPAKVICSLEVFLEKEKHLMNEENTFGDNYTLRNPELSEKHKKEMIEACNKHEMIFIE